MLHRYFEINEYIDRSNRKLLDVLLTPMEDAELEAIFEEMKVLERVNKRLQAGGVGDRELSLLEVRKLFHAVISKFLETDSI
ncbi:hypothetical protein DVH05_006620 [Phytophthora capsici]|nr:hypothetical protein DVH05_006620 [Phytophthora capsici]